MLAMYHRSVRSHGFPTIATDTDAGLSPNRTNTRRNQVYRGDTLEDPLRRLQNQLRAAGLPAGERKDPNGAARIPKRGNRLQASIIWHAERVAFFLSEEPCLIQKINRATLTGYRIAAASVEGIDSRGAFHVLRHYLTPKKEETVM